MTGWRQSTKWRGPGSPHSGTDGFAGRRAGAGGRPLLSRPRGAVGSGAAAVELAAVSVVALSRGLCACVLVALDVVRFVCVIRVPVRSRVSRACPFVCPGSPGVFLPVPALCSGPFCYISHFSPTCFRPFLCWRLPRRPFEARLTLG